MLYLADGQYHETINLHVITARPHAYSYIGEESDEVRENAG